jgi:hypothetical protein
VYEKCLASFDGPFENRSAWDEWTTPTPVGRLGSLEISGPNLLGMYFSSFE